MAVLIGSQALRARLTRNFWREPKDWDLIMTRREFDSWVDRNTGLIDHMTMKHSRKVKCRLRNGEQMEIEFAEAGDSSSLLLSTVREQLVTIPGGLAYAAPVEALYWTKKSHVYWPVHWKKTITDLSRMAPHVRSFSSAGKAYYEMRLKENTVKFGKTHARLNMSNDEFFKKSERIGRQFDHDFLHGCVAIGDHPAYLSFKTDPNRAAMSRELFERGEHGQKLSCVVEEAMVIGLERRIIPRITTDPIRAYEYGLQRVCTTLTSGWFRDFAIDNYAAVAMPTEDYVDRFKTRTGWE